ncbi:phosphatase PAP2 family protein [Solibacillus sp. FSL H8-0538]|uniref:phosphatase PAP2 family protein n=1 Tax=Solibacillus sp. FSL H8-0538 TaxID=2921400 RepID=UPI0030FA3EEF
MKNWAYPLAAVTFVVFLLLAINYEKLFTVEFDTTMSSLLGGNELLILFHYIGDTIFVVCVALITMLVLWIRGRNYRGMLFVLLTVAAGNLLNQLLKAIFERPRPEIVEQLTSYSFPSGHSMTGVLYLLALAYLVSEVLIVRKQIIGVWVVAVTLACLIGLSRIAESRHFATDVLAGWSMGYTWFVVCVIWYEYSKRRTAKNKRLRN